MIRLAIIFFLISMIESQNCDYDIDQLKEIKQIFHDSEKRMKKATQCQSKNAAIVIGNGRGGKSTLINYLMGNELVATQSNKYEDIKINKANNNIRGPEIGSGTLSTTTIPTKWNSIRSELHNLDIWDSAGFADNRKKMQDLNNSFHLYHLTRKVENLKLILIISFDEIINDNVDQMRRLLSSLERYFNNTFEVIFPAISVIISKAPEMDDFENLIDYKYINTKLNNSFLSSSQLDVSPVSKRFIRNIIENNNRLAIFKRAQQTGTVTSDIDVNIIQAINNCESINKSIRQNIGLTFSQESENCLLNASQILFPIQEILQFQNALFSSLNENFDTSCQSNNTITLQLNSDELKKINESLNTLTNNSKTEVKIKTLEMISDNLKNFINNNDIDTKISLIQFLDFILKRDEMSYISTPEITEVDYEKKKVEGAKDSERVLNNTINNISNLNVRKEEQSAWQQFLKDLARFLQLDGSAMTMG
ncbi:reticulocyte-binding protein 2 homolog a-like isoform X2 [Leptopilina heterotoma]|uniref:reticulocyte-binding protein 2 homolog a-like isoform X2 n=1 Tax=Leptopilina heterotoma TaxID=63436 RepID=UPI001CA9414C|nr:reticulocyte-binding protein 2 homolog a-like isoform X2 [Leptopilina heterotoma]